MGAGVGVAFAAVVATWFIAQAILGQFSQYGDQLQAVTGLLAIGVLLVIMNWFFHKVYWTQWIGRRNDQRKDQPVTIFNSTKCHMVELKPS